MPLVDMYKAIGCLGQKRKLFVSEADFQLELAWILKDMYPEAKVLCEYTPVFASDTHIDILVIIDGKWIPVELKYKTKSYTKFVDGIQYTLKNHSAKDVNCYLYLKDIARIEAIKCTPDVDFAEGYTVFLTNDLSYTQKPRKEDCIYKAFSLAEGEVKTGKLDWAENAGAGTKKNVEAPITLVQTYPCQWMTYSTIDSSSSGTFQYLLHRIR